LTREFLRKVYRFDFGAGETNRSDSIGRMDAFPGLTMINSKVFKSSYLQETEKYLVADCSHSDQIGQKKGIVHRNKSSNKEFKIEINKEEQGI